MVLVEKKEKKKNPWFDYVQKIREENKDKNLKQKDIIKLARKTYVPLGKKGE